MQGRTGPTVLRTVRGRDLLDLTYRQPLDGSDRPVVPADYVTTEDGTGLVHTAPGHGEDDYQTGLKHGIEVYCPVQADGRFDSTTPNYVTGLKVFDANPVIVEKLKELGTLFAEQTIHHRYPHDWRSKTPTIFRATEQWFIALDKAYEVDGVIGHAAGAGAEGRGLGGSSCRAGGGRGCGRCWRTARTGASRGSVRGGYRSLSFTTTTSRC